MRTAVFGGTSAAAIAFASTAIAADLPVTRYGEQTTIQREVHTYQYVTPPVVVMRPAPLVRETVMVRRPIVVAPPVVVETYPVYGAPVYAAAPIYAYGPGWRRGGWGWGH